MLIKREFYFNKKKINKRCNVGKIEKNMKMERVFKQSEKKLLGTTTLF